VNGICLAMLCRRIRISGAITIVGSESVTVDSCLLTRLDGNAIFIGGYNRNLTVNNNEFSFIGDSAMASWGDTSAVSGV
jgi:hypothetical protein